VRYRLPADLAPEAARRLGLEVEKRAAMAVGRAQILGIQWPVDEGPAVDRDESGRLVLTFASSADARQARGRLAASLAGMPDVEAWVEPRGDAFPEVAGIIASAATPERAEALAGRVTARLRRSGLVPLRDSRHHPRPALLLSWDTPRLAALGLDRDRLEEQVRSGLEDEQAGRIHIEGVEPEILLRAVEPRDPALLPVALSPDAGVVPLTALARLAPGTRPGLLERWNGRPAVRLEFRGGDVDAGAALADLSLAPDEQVSPVGLRVLRWGKP
jgi:multidrug efflux pump subunit AcrB